MAASNLRRVFSNRNVFVVSVTNSLATFFRNIYTPYWAKFLQEDIGLSIPQIGLLRAFQRSEQLLFTFPGGLLADRIGRKKVTLMGAAARAIAPLIYLFASSWELIFVGTIISAMQSVSTAAYSAMIAESLPRSQRGTGYGVYNMVRRVPMVFTGIVGGLLMDSFGIGLGTRICFAGAVGGAIVIFVSRYLFLTETLKRQPTQKTSLREDLKDVVPLFSGSLKAMQVTSALYQFAAGLTSELVIIYVIDVIGLSYTEWGLVSTSMNVVSLFTSMPGGMMADKYDRVKLITFARSIHPVTNLGYIFLRNFWHILAVRLCAGVGMGLSGAAEMGHLGGASWESLMADLVPPEKRGRFTGLMSTFNGIVSLPSPFIGSILWEADFYGPEKTMLTGISIGLISTTVFNRFVQDPRGRRGMALERDEEETKDGSGG